MWEGILRDAKMGTFVAEDDSGSIVGFANCGAARDTRDFGGELYAIYVLQFAQLMGIGKRLVLAVVNDLAARGFSSMLVWVLTENPSRRFYEGLGGEALLSRNIAIGGKTLKETGYGWKDLSSLITRLGRLPGTSF
jgi:ribosomal protein S18 acetylase RimI-like enzyme